jgi:hypothetical protein
MLFLFLVHSSFGTLVCFGFVSMSFFFVSCGVASVFCVLATLLITKLFKLAKHTKGFFLRLKFGVLGAYGVVCKTYKNIQGLGEFIALPNSS